MTTSGRPLDRQSIHLELERARVELDELVARATTADLRQRTNGTRWTNAQMLFHMVFGYMVVRRLLPVVRWFGRRPEGASRLFARALDAGTHPFHVVNYLGSCGGALVFHGRRLVRLMDRTVAALHRRLDAESEHDLAVRMHFPAGWDPYFHDAMSVAEVYRYGTQHFDHHARQLTVRGPAR